MPKETFLIRLAESLDQRTVSELIYQVPGRKRLLLSRSLNHLYSIGTCSRGCRGGDHILEAIVGRSCNHSIGALRLIADHLYDESLNLARSIAEATNLLFLFNEDPDALATWQRASRRDRLRAFGPAAVRSNLEQRGAPLPISEDRYRELCEMATHVTPSTRPNNHTAVNDRVGYIGGVLDTTQRSRALDTLLLYCSLSSMVACQIFGHREDVEELARFGDGVFDA